MNHYLYSVVSVQNIFTHVRMSNILEKVIEPAKKR